MRKHFGSILNPPSVSLLPPNRLCNCFKENRWNLFCLLEVVVEFWGNAVCSVFTVLYSMTISSKTLTNVFVLLGIAEEEHLIVIMIKIAMKMMMMMITEIEKRLLWNGFVCQDNHIWHIAPQRAHGSYCNWAGLNINGPLSIYPSYLNLNNTKTLSMTEAIFRSACNPWNPGNPSTWGKLFLGFVQNYWQKLK